MHKYSIKATVELQKYKKIINDLNISELLNLNIIALAIKSEHKGSALKKLEQMLKIKSPDFKCCKKSRLGNVRVLRMSEDQLFIIYHSDSEELLQNLLNEIDKFFYITEQTDAWTGIKISGKKVYDCMERLCSLDLSQENFDSDYFARTTIEQMGSIIIKSKTNEFELFSASSSAKSFLHAIETAASNI